MIDTNYKYAQWSTNVNTFGMNWQTYHEGGWYNPAEKTYDEFVDELKETIRQKVLKDHPHLIAFDKQDDKVIRESKLHETIKNNFIHPEDSNLKFEPIKSEKINKGTIEEPIPQPQSDESIIQDIENCNDIKIIESYRFVAKKKPAIKEAVDKRLAELTK